MHRATPRAITTARAGEIRDFTGVSAPYEAPEAAELELDTQMLAPEACVEAVLDLLMQRSIISGK